LKDISTQIDLLETFVENDDFKLARRLSGKLIPVFETREYNPEEARFYFLLGEIKRVFADPDSKDSFSKAFSRSGANTALLCKSCHQLAAIAIGEQDFLKADQLISEGLAQRFDPLPLYQVCQFNLRGTQIYRTLWAGDIPSAVESLEFLKNDFEVASPDAQRQFVLILMRLIFDLETARSNFRLAGQTLQKSAEICTATGKTDCLMYAAILVDLALSARSQCNASQSLEYLRKSLEITREKVGFASVSSTYILKDLADTYRVLRDPTGVTTSCRQILAIERRTGRSILTSCAKEIIFESALEN
jgi:hypothetical protein